LLDVWAYFGGTWGVLPVFESVHGVWDVVGRERMISGQHSSVDASGRSIEEVL
jgi:hypothetical protein